MFKRRFLDNTLFIIPHFAQVYLGNRTGYRSTVKCIVKKKNIFRSYAKLKIKISPSGPFSQILSHFVTGPYIYTSHLTKPAACIIGVADETLETFSYRGAAHRNGCLQVDSVKRQRQPKHFTYNSILLRP